MAQILKSIRDLELQGKSVFMRLDFNVPLTDADAEGHRQVADDSRIVEALPTLRYAMEKGAKVVIGSHLGRPDGKRSSDSSMEPVAHHLSALLGQEVTLADDSVGDGIEMMIRSSKQGSVLLLENLRWHKGEEENDPEYSRQLARLCDLYVTDAFGTAHRKHASTWGVPSIMPLKAMGFLIEKELTFLGRMLNEPKKPFYALLGGSKVTDKIKTIESLMLKVNGIAIGGAMAHAFWAVQGDTIPEGAKQPKPADVEAARAILKEAKRREMPLLLPSDTNLGFDIGPKTIERFSNFLADAKTIFWNGPVGWFEKPEYSTGTFELAKRIAGLDALKVVGGGDTVSAIKQSGYAEKFDHLSTGGGAVLEYIENGSLPGIEVLKTFRQAQSPVLT
jgi:phosphoglycerate kinase